MGYFISSSSSFGRESFYPFDAERKENAIMPNLVYYNGCFSELHHFLLLALGLPISVSITPRLLDLMHTCTKNWYICKHVGISWKEHSQSLLQIFGYFRLQMDVRKTYVSNMVCLNLLPWSLIQFNYSLKSQFALHVENTAKVVHLNESKHKGVDKAFNRTGGENNLWMGYQIKTDIKCKHLLVQTKARKFSWDGERLWIWIHSETTSE